ncbi:MAG: hypothetical protein MSIBF_01835 [Candidatus Altiarchaeales archaeon IMC4]|nr:MAG: hypothetical protein MSIBF_01835 [Candidatus Altiarchaeales archaeon IMC4]
MSYAQIMPEIIVGVFALLTLIFSVTMFRGAAGYVAIAGLLLSLFSLCGLEPSASVQLPQINSFNYNIDAFATIFKAIFLSVALLISIASIDFIRGQKNRAEYYCLILFATLGMMVVSSAADLLTLYIGLELAGISSYLLAAFTKHDKESTEAATKYMLMGAFFSAFFLFGVSMIYGATGSIALPDIAKGAGTVAFMGLLFIIAGFGFKMAAAPFHMWAPDVYGGAPTTVSGLLAGASKKMGFAAALRVLVFVPVIFHANLAIVLAVMALLSMTAGNIIALSQRDMKRMLAYSSIAQAGYILIGLAVMGGIPEPRFAVGASILYMIIHAFMKAGAFIAVAAVAYMAMGNKQICRTNLVPRDCGGNHEGNVNDYIGLAKKAPITAFCMMVFLLSLAGIVPLGGFVGKLFLLIAAFKAGTLGLILGIGLIVNSIISCYYYGRVIKYMYFVPSDGKRQKEPLAFVIPMLIAAAIVIIAGVYPVPFIDAAMNTAGSLISAAGVVAP